MKKTRFEFIEFEGHPWESKRKPPPVDLEPEPIISTVPGVSFEVLEVIGQEGRELSEFSAPQGLCVDIRNNLYVADSYNHRIQKFNEKGEFLFALGTKGSKIGQFRSPQGVGTDSRLNFYVVEEGNHRVQKFNPEGNFLLAFGKQGSRPGEFNAPTGIAVDNRDNIYVVDSGNNRIQKFAPSGELVALISGEETQYINYITLPDKYKLTKPHGIAVDSQGNIYVADALNHRIIKLESAKEAKVRVSAFGIFGYALGCLNTPQDIALDAQGNIYVVESGNHRMQKFSPEGKPILTVGYQGTGLGEFESPSGIAVDSEGYIYIADTMNHRIQKIVIRG